MAQGFNPPGVIEPFGIFSNGAVQPPGRVLHVAGQVAWDVDGNVVGKGDMAAQTRQVLDNVKAVVESVGSLATVVVMLHAMFSKPDRISASSKPWSTAALNPGGYVAAPAREITLGQTPLPPTWYRCRHRARTTLYHPAARRRSAAVGIFAAILQSQAFF